MKKFKTYGLIVLFIVIFILGITSAIKNPGKPKEAFPFGYSMI